MSLEDFFSAVNQPYSPGDFADVAYHRRSYRQWDVDYRLLVQTFSHGRRADELEQTQRELFNWLSDERNLWAACRHLASRGSPASGPNGLTWEDFGVSEMWDQLRHIRDVLREGRYSHGRVRKCTIAKASGTGTRTIYVADIQDRTIARAAQQILRPWLELHPAPYACCQFGRGTHYALALAELLTHRLKRYQWGCQDLKDAFDAVPRGRLMDILRQRVPCEPLLDLVQKLMAPAGKRGVPQGSALSPVLFEFYREHFVDAPWRRRFPGVPMLSYADDLLLLASATQSTDVLHDGLRAIALPAGFQLKIPRDAMFKDVRSETIKWLGFRCRWHNNRLIKRPVGLSFDDDQQRQELLDRLVRQFRDLHEGGDAHRRARNLLTGMLSFAGPGYKDTDRPGAYEIVCEAASCAAFEELLTFQQFESHWRRSFECWRATVKRVAKTMPPHLSQAFEFHTPLPSAATSVAELGRDGAFNLAPWEGGPIL